MGAGNELVFAALGPSGAGKTTMLACMQKRFDDLLPGSLAADRTAFSSLQAAYEKLEAEANSNTLEFGVGVENTENLREYSFTINAGKTNIPMRFYDFPGGWIDPERSDTENYNRVAEIMNRSRVIFIAVNTPYLMEANGHYRKEARIDETTQMLKQGLIHGNDNKLVLIIPIKCEKYTRGKAELQKMYAVIDKEFADVFALTNNPVYRKRLAIAVLPIHTVGNATFSRFERHESSRLPREIYLKNRNTKFSPKYADQPLRYAVSFLLNEFARGGDVSLNDSFARADFKELCEFIRNGMEINNGLFKIYNGSNLITDTPEIKAVREEKQILPTVHEKKNHSLVLWAVIVMLAVVIAILLLRPPEVIEKIVEVEKPVVVEKSFGQYLKDKIIFWK